MISVSFTEEELRALFHVFIVNERVDWDAYDAARRRIITEGRKRFTASEQRVDPPEGADQLDA